MRNPKKQNAESSDDGLEKSAIVWVNELRLTELSSNGGVAGTGRLEATLADLGRVTLSGSYSSAGFGAIDSDITSNEFMANSTFAVSTDLELGKFLENTGLKIPMHIDYGETNITPKYNPYDPDIKMEDALAALNTPEEQNSCTHIDFTFTYNIPYFLFDLRAIKRQTTGFIGRRIGGKCCFCSIYIKVVL